MRNAQSMAMVSLAESNGNRFVTHHWRYWWHIVLGGFNTFMEYTNTLEFCVSCHEMDTVYQEYTQSIHYENNAGVQAICSDYHVPKPWTAKLVRKVKASNEIYHKLKGTIDTPEKFEAKRMELANNVWR
jgi:nitrate/TMAO reductase-like tetraheme cytochrome c subunit